MPPLLLNSQGLYPVAGSFFMEANKIAVYRGLVRTLVN